MGTEHLHKSRYDNINDEFYTKYEDVASELINYDFEGKRVFCPCDTEDSAFVQYFKTYFHYLSVFFKEAIFSSTSSNSLLREPFSNFSLAAAL